jgi:hypothetical protein
MLMKCQYLNKKHGYNRIIYATGTPISNSMSELYTMMNYLRPDLLKEAGVANFDDWAAQFARVTTQMEMSASGGYKPKKRLNEFVNLPELMEIFHTFSDVKNAEDLNLPTPTLIGKQKTDENDNPIFDENGKPVYENKPITILAKPSEFQLEYIQKLAERAKEINKGHVNPREDNFLKITHEARLLGLDSRTIDPSAEVTPDCKVNLLIDNVEKIYHETTDPKGGSPAGGIQAIFCDIAVNGDDGKFSVYENIKFELVKRGIPAEEICFASDAKTPEQRANMFLQLNNGDKRIVIASTAKLGTGANFQKRLCALHNLDIPWRPSDDDNTLRDIHHAP